MSVGSEDITKLCVLAQLEVPSAEIPELSAKLSSIVSMVGALQSADTTHITPMAHPLDKAQRLRPDTVTETDHRELYQRNAPAVEQGLYLVPKVIDG